MEKILAVLFYFINTRLIRVGCWCLLFCLMGLSGRAQYFQFSQFNFTPQRVNPAMAAATNYVVYNFNYRNQKTAGGFSLSSTSLSVSYPFINRKGFRWAGVGLSLLDDRSGAAGIYSTQEAALSYAVNIPLVKFHTLTMGGKVLYINQNVDLDKLLTGSQFIPDRGFDHTRDNKEGTGRWKESHATFSAGMHWQNTDKRGSRLSYAGFSFFDFNKTEALQKTYQGMNSTLVLSAGQRVWRKEKVTVFPEVLYTVSASNQFTNIGFITSYELKSYSKELPERIDIISKYVVGRWGILGIQFHKRNYSFGVSYDVPVRGEQTANLGTIEFGFEWKNLVRPLRAKKPRRRSEPLVAPQDSLKIIQADTLNQEVTEEQEVTTPSVVHQENETLSERLRAKQDSVLARADAGKISQEPLILDKATLHFNFEFNSSGLGQDATNYLDELVEALKDNPLLNISIVGHTDNVGSDKFNLKLSFERARVMYHYLVKKGVEADRIAVDGKGMREPLNKNETEEDRAKNRRVELTILYEE